MNRLLAVLLILFSLPVLGQISNRFDVSVNYTSSVFIEKVDSDFKTSEGGVIPSMLGNMESSNGYRISILYSDISFKYQPGILIDHKDYTFNDNLTRVYNNSFNFNSTSIGITNKYNILKYGHFKVVPYLKGNIVVKLCKLDAPSTSYVAIEQTQDPNTSYETTFEMDAVNKSFIVPSFELVTGAEAKLSEKLFLTFEFLFSLSKYPDIDMKSPSIFKEGNVSIGIQYKLVRNKRFYL